MNKKHLLLIIGITIFSVMLLQTYAQNAAAPTVIQINADQVISKVSPIFYGLMTEEINYSYDGGLYAELIRNRAFKDTKVLAFWTLITSDGTSGTIAIDSVPQENTALTRNLRLDITSVGPGGRAGIANEGYWGIPVKPETTYISSFYAKAGNGFDGPLTVAIESNDGKTVFATAQVKMITGSWQKYSVTLKTGKVEPSATNKFVITTGTKGTVWFSLVSLFPPTFNNRPNGNRIDIMQLMADMNPKFLRFPGGNYLQGRTLATRFDWKKTLGDISQRPTHFNDAWRYLSSDGMGLLEFMFWCEDLKMEPILGVFAGFFLSSRNPFVGPDLQPYIDDALNEIEYLVGDANTKWGAVRIKDGHPKPFALKYVEIGNEDWFDRTNSYDKRFTQLFTAIKAKYPNIEIIASTAVTTTRPDILDLHQYMNPAQALTSAHRYDKYKRTDPKVFIGEYATRVGTPTTNHQAGLCDAAYLTGLERNADIIWMCCYAPIFVNVNPGAMQWRSDLMGYDALTSYGSPSYQVQKMFANNIGDVLVKSSIEGVPVVSDTLQQVYYSITKDSKKGTLFLKMVNMSEVPRPVKINISGVNTIAPEGQAIVLSSAKLDDTNSITDPKKIVPVTSKATGLGKSFTYDLKPYSVTVLQLTGK